MVRRFPTIGNGPSISELKGNGDKRKHMIQVETVRNFCREWRLGSWLLGIGSALIAVVVLGMVIAYLLPGSWTLTKSVRERLPFPMVNVGFRGVASFRNVADDLSAVKGFYENQDFSMIGLRVDFTTEDGKKRLKIREREIINRMLENEVIWREAKSRGIEISREQADKAVAEQLSAEGNDVKGVENRIMRLYGWSISQFTEKVVRPSLYEEELKKLFDADTSRFAEAKKKADEAKKRLADGRAFADVAAELSEGRTADKGGDMGWFAYDNLDESLRDAARNQKIGVAGDVLGSELGFHILVVNERKTENGKELVHVSQIFVRKQTFGDWLAERMKMVSVHVLAPEYQWNPETAQVEFRDPELRQFEANILQNSEGDASVLF